MQRNLFHSYCLGGVSSLKCARVTLSSSSRQGHGQACAGAAACAGAHLGVWGPCPPQHRLGLCLHRAELPAGESCTTWVPRAQPGRHLQFLVLQGTLPVLVARDTSALKPAQLSQATGLFCLRKLASSSQDTKCNSGDFVHLKALSSSL